MIEKSFQRCGIVAAVANTERRGDAMTSAAAQQN